MSDAFVDAVVKALTLNLPDEVRNLLINLSNERVVYLQRLEMAHRVVTGELDHTFDLEPAAKLPDSEDGESVSGSDPTPSPSPQTTPEDLAESNPNSKEDDK